MIEVRLLDRGSKVFVCAPIVASESCRGWQEKLTRPTETYPHGEDALNKGEG